MSNGNSNDAPEGRKLLKSIYSKNNDYLLMDKAYKDDKTLVLAKAHGFCTVIPPKKIVNSFGYTINNFTNNATTSKDISLNCDVLEKFFSF